MLELIRMKGDILAVILATFGAGFGLGAIVYRTNPASTTFSTQILFFISLALSIWGVVTIMGFFFRRLFARNFNPRQTLQQAFRQGLICSLVVVTLIIIQKVL